MGLAEEPDSSSESRSKSVLIIVRSCSSCSCDALSVDSGCSDTTCSFSARLCPLPSAIRFFFGSGRKRGKIISVAGKKKETKKMEHSLSGEKVDHKIFLPNTLLTHTYKKTQQENCWYKAMHQSSTSGVRMRRSAFNYAAILHSPRAGYQQKRSSIPPVALNRK